MRKVLLTFATLSIAFAAMAEGYQVNTLSARQGGMGHTGVAQKLGAESMFFNPAGMAFMTGTVDLAGSVNAVMAKGTAKNASGNWSTDNDPSTPMMVSGAFSVYDNLKAGITLYTPYGSAINWGRNWGGALMNQEVQLKSFTLQPTLSWRILPNLSVGGGVMVSWGNVDLYKGLVNPSSMDMLMGILELAGQMPAGVPEFGETMPASLNINGKSNVTAAFNLGVMYDINSKWTAGASFRTKSMLKVKKGLASVSYANQVAQQVLESSLSLIDQANFSAEMPMPWVLSFGASYKPASNLLFALDAQLTGWSAYKTLGIFFSDPAVSAYDQVMVKDYHNSWTFRLGAQWGVTERCDLRAGCVLDFTPVNSDYYNPETPGMTKIEPTVGLSFRPAKGLSVDLSLLYVAGLGKDGAQVSYPDLLAAKINALTGTATVPSNYTFKADYSVHAWVPSIGVGYKF